MSPAQASSQPGCSRRGQEDRKVATSAENEQQVACGGGGASWRSLGGCEPCCSLKASSCRGCCQLPLDPLTGAQSRLYSAPAVIRGQMGWWVGCQRRCQPANSLSPSRLGLWRHRRSLRHSSVAVSAAQHARMLGPSPGSPTLRHRHAPRQRHQHKSTGLHQGASVQLFLKSRRETLAI